MTNTTYFHTVVREPYSSSSSSSYQSPETSRSPIIQQGDETKHKDSRYIQLAFNRVFKGWMDKKFLYRQQFQQRQVGLGQAQVQLSHPNLVECFRYCLHPTPHRLVSEAKSRPLKDYLVNDCSFLLPWSLRMRVALDVAEGLDFLHRNNIFYHNFGVSNVLLDTNCNAKLTDLGIFDDLGEVPMMAKEDIYSFGVLLLEIVSGPKGVKAIEKELVECAMPYLDDNCLYVLDRRLKGQYSLQNAHEVVNLAYQCLNREAKLRPRIEEVVAELRQVQDSKFMTIIVNEAPLKSEYFLVAEEKRRTDCHVVDTNQEHQISEWLRLDGSKARDSKYIHLGFKKFRFEELKNLPKNFLEQDSEGYFNREFKGWIHKKSLKASKLGRGSISVSVQLLDPQQFQDCHGGMELIQRRGQLSHPNLVKYFGYCLHQGHLLLVSELMPQTLDDYLFNESISPLPWSLRMRVALGAAEGLAFLHKNHISYHNFGISNVLLDKNYNAKLTNLGIFDDRGEVPTMAKEDIYSFGVLLLEIVTGLKAVKAIEKEVVEWAMPYLEHNSLYVDRRLKGQYSQQNAPEVVNVAYHCLRSRPRMEEVVDKLKQVQDSQFMNSIVDEDPLALEYLLVAEEERTADYDVDTDMEDQVSE